MCHHHDPAEWAAVREALEADGATEAEDEPVDPEADDEHRLPPIPPSD